MERREFLKKSALAALGTAVAGTGLAQAFNHINDNQSKTDKMKMPATVAAWTDLAYSTTTFRNSVHI